MRCETRDIKYERSGFSRFIKKHSMNQTAHSPRFQPWGIRYETLDMSVAALAASLKNIP